MYWLPFASFFRFSHDVVDDVSFLFSSLSLSLSLFLDSISTDHEPGHREIQSSKVCNLPFAMHEITCCFLLCYVVLTVFWLLPFPSFVSRVAKLKAIYYNSFGFQLVVN